MTFCIYFMQADGVAILKSKKEERMKAVLDRSFNQLDRGAQEMFLDIASVCANRHKDSLLVAWRNCDANADFNFRSLLNFSLISVVLDTVKIHDILRELGKEKILDGLKETRVWNDVFNIGMVYSFLKFSF